MRTLRLIIFFAAMTMLARAAAPTYGTLVIGSSGATIYEGASARSKVAGKAYEGDEFVLRADKTFSGFYKVEYNGHICFIGAGQGKVQKQEEEQEEEQPTAVPTRISTKVATRLPTAEPEEEVTEVPTLAPTRAPARMSTLAPTAEPEEEATEAPTLAPTRIPTRGATLAPTLVPEEATEIPTEVPTRIPSSPPTKAPTLAPTREPEPEATEIPTLVQTRVYVAPAELPTAVPTRVYVAPTAIPTAVPTRYVMPSAVPTRAWPTPAPTRAWPTAVPTATWAPQPTAVPELRRAKGRVIERRQTQRNTATTGGNRTQTRNYYQGSGSGGGTTIRTAPRDPNKLSGFMFTLPLGMGKPYEVRPAFKPDASTLDSRNVNGSGFVGLGIEGRLWPILRIFGDWTAYSHWTRAADAGSVAPAVDVPSVASVISSTDIRYAMDTHGFRLGLKLGLPLGAHVEPWVGGGAGLYVWTAEYRDEAKSVSYGDDHGLEFGFTGMGGIDFNFSTGGLLFRVTPFGEIGAPVVNPTITDIAGTGSNWHDNQGTAVMVPRRLGLMLGIGF